MQFTQSVTAVFAALVVTATTVAYLITAYYKRRYSYWKKRDVSVCATPVIPWGNIGDVVFSRRSLAEVLTDLYVQCKSEGARHAGMYFMSSPAYVPVDPEIIKCILVKDFQHFNDRGIYHDEVNDPLSAHLFALPDKKWKNLRVKFSPTFSSGKIKSMYPILVEKSEVLHSVCEELVNLGKPFDVKDLVARYTSDVIGSFAFGIECNSLRNPNADFITMGKRVFEHSKWDALKVFLTSGFSNPGIIQKFFTIDKEAVNFFHKSILETVSFRDARGEETGQRNDFLQMIMNLRKDKSKDFKAGNNEDDVSEDEDKNNTKADRDATQSPTTGAKALTLDEIAAQAFLMYIAGYDTSATTSAFCLYEIVKNPAIQDEMRLEIERVLAKYDGQITYEACSEMKYLERVFHETLRKYPTLPYLNRHCIKDFPIPDSTTIIASDTPVLIPVMGLHRDPEYFPEPDVFDPERFSDENKSKIPSFTFLPFGEGPRNCIGSRLGMLKMKVAFATLLKNYSFTLNERTQDPLKLVSVPQNHLINIEGGLWANIHKI